MKCQLFVGGLALKSPTACIAKLVAYQHLVINWHKKYGRHLGPVGNGDEIPVLFDILINTAIYAEG
jgi:hypothetical protein